MSLQTSTPARAADPAPRPSGRAVRRLTAAWRTWLPYAMAVLVYAIAVAVSPQYLHASQIHALLTLGAMLGIVAIGQTLVILLGGIDLSVSAVITLVNLVVATIVAGVDANVPRAVLVGLGIGFIVGIVNGLGIHLLRLPHLIMTLASFTILTGVALLYSGGAPKGGSSPALGRFAAGRVWGPVPPSAVLWAVLAVVTIVFLRRSTVGRRVYAVGLNPVAATYAGVRVGTIVVAMYALSGILAAAVGVLITGYTGSSYFGSGDPYQLASIAAVVIGGVSIYGGRGGYGGTIAGTAIIVVLESLLRVINVAEGGRRVGYGLLILLLLISYGRARSLRE